MKARGLGCAALLLVLARPTHADEPSRAEDPNYDPDAEAAAARGARGGASDTPYGGADPASGASSAAEPRLEGDALREQVPDIAFRTWPPTPQLTFEFGGIYPFVWAGGGLGLAGYVGDSLRLSASLFAGITNAGVPNSPATTFGTYGEVLVGVRVLSGAGRIGASVDDADRLKRGETRPRTHHLFNAWLPGTHALLVEGGMFTGGVPRARCLSNCAGTDFNVEKTYVSVNPQLFYLEAGLRYVFFSSAFSERQPNVDRRWRIETFLHVVMRPLGDTKAHGLMLLDETRVQKSPLGARGGFTIPFCGHHCAAVTIMAGYLPSPDTLTLSGGAEY